jgi:hypothetical protein
MSFLGPCRMEYRLAGRFELELNLVASGRRLIRDEDRD